MSISRSKMSNSSFKIGTLKLWFAHVSGRICANLTEDLLFNIYVIGLKHVMGSNK